MRGGSQTPSQSIFLENPGRREGFASPLGLATDSVNLQGTLPAPPAYSGFCQQGKLSPHWFILWSRVLFRLLLTCPYHIQQLNSCIQRTEGQVLLGNITLLCSCLTFFPTTDSDNFQREKSSRVCTACSVPRNSTSGFEKNEYSPLSSSLQKAWRQPAKTIPKSERFAGKPRQLDQREAASTGKDLQWGNTAGPASLLIILSSRKNQADYFSSTE